MHYTLDTSTLANGPHTLVATVTDETGATATASRAVTVSNATPLAPLTASFTAPAMNATPSGTTTIAMAQSGASGDATFQLAVDGTVVSTQTASAATAARSCAARTPKRSGISTKRAGCTRRRGTSGARPPRTFHRSAMAQAA